MGLAWQEVIIAVVSIALLVGLFSLIILGIHWFVYRGPKLFSHADDQLNELSQKIDYLVDEIERVSDA